MYILKLYRANVYFETHEQWHEQIIGLMSREFANGLEDMEFNPKSSHTKDSKMILNSGLFNAQYYKVRIKG